MGSNANEPIVMEVFHCTTLEEGVTQTLKARDYKDPLVVCADVYNQTTCTDVTPTVTAAVGGGNTSGPKLIEVNNMDEPTYVVRRLTPVECERLQGYPDNFTLIGEPETVTVTDYEYEYDEDGNVTKKTPIGEHEETEWFYTDEDGKKKKCADSARYKALGNSICLPYWFHLFQQMANYLPEDATLGSLFDGIGGFPLCWEEIHGRGTARWASEIEAFPIAVTKRRFPEPDDDV